MVLLRHPETLTRGDEMAEYRKGDKVKVYDADSIINRVQYGTVVRVNKKSVSVILDSCERVLVDHKDLNFD